VRLLLRTTRRFAVTEVGERFHAHCRAMLEEAQAAQDVVDELRAEPRGIVRVSCPTALAQTVVAHVLPDFLGQFPKVQVRVLATNRRVDVINEGIDIAIRVRTKLDTDAALVSRSFGQSRVLLAANPKFLDGHGRPDVPQDLEKLPLLSQFEHDGAQVLELLDATGAKVTVEMRARLISGEFGVLYEAAKRGLGVTALPEFVCAPAILRKELEVVLPAWSIPMGVAHFVYASRRGLLPSVRAFVDFLAERLPEAMRLKHEQCMKRDDNPG
jgi:DNA-binding transcriptional LysR family regulator